MDRALHDEVASELAAFLLGVPQDVLQIKVAGWSLHLDDPD